MKKFVGWFVVSFFLGGFIGVSCNRYANDCFAAEGGAPHFGCHEKGSK